MYKVTNIGNDERRFVSREGQRILSPKQSVIVRKYPKIVSLKHFKVEEVNEEGKKIKKEVEENGT